MNLTVQYSIVCVIVIAAIIRIVTSIIKMRKKKNSGCYGCCMHEICGQTVKSGKMGNSCFISEKNADKTDKSRIY